MLGEHSDTIYGSNWSGSITNELIDKKRERTDIYEDPDTLYNHFRESLRDTGPDKTIFAYEDKRKSIGVRSGI